MLLPAMLLALGLSDRRASPAIAQDYVLPQTFPLLAPFPIVRIAGITTPRGAKLSLVTVKAAPGVTILSTCAPRRHCSYTRRSTTVSGRPGRTRTVHIRGFERSLRAGVNLRLYVMHANRTGKFASFKIRLNRQPLRGDRCVRGLQAKVVSCPSS